MRQIVLDPQLRAKLNGLNKQLEMCDESGKTLGHFVPAELYKKMLYAAVLAACPHSPDELERRRRETGGRTLAEIWKNLG
jgi:hypothetical protein